MPNLKMPLPPFFSNPIYSSGSEALLERLFSTRHLSMVPSAQLSLQPIRHFLFSPYFFFFLFRGGNIGIVHPFIYTFTMIINLLILSFIVLQLSHLYHFYPPPLLLIPSLFHFYALSRKQPVFVQHARTHTRLSPFSFTTPLTSPASFLLFTNLFSHAAFVAFIIHHTLQVFKMRTCSASHTIPSSR